MATFDQPTGSPETSVDSAPRAEAQPRAGVLATPRLVIRGESTWIGQDPDTGERALMVPVPGKRHGEVFLVPLPDDQAHPSGAIIDWLNFTFPMQRTLPELFPLVWEYLGPKFAPATERRTGFHFYKRSFDLGETGAKFAFGGNEGTGLISLTGEGCYLVADWSRAVELGRDILGGQISRTDPARDDYLGVHSVDDALQLYRDGLFGAGGRRPMMKQYGNWDSPDGTGRSIVIGSRNNGKRLEVYEKGMQLGARWHPWVRWELCIGNTGRQIPWEVLLEPGRYLAGAYPKALGWVCTEASRIVTLQKQTRISYDAMTGNVSNHYGKFLGQMLKVEGSAEKVLAKVVRAGTPRRLQHPAIERPEEWLE